MNIYDVNSIDSLSWPETEEGQYAKNYLYPLIKNGASHYIDNADTEMVAIEIDKLILPATINNTEYENSYVCSPYTLYVNCGFEKLDEINNAIAKHVAGAFLKVFKKAFQKGKINKIIYVNNWLFTTNLHPKLSLEQIHTITEELKKRYPDHAIAFRSLSKFDNLTTLEALQKEQYDLIATRPIFFLDTKNKEPFKARMFKSDLSILKKTDYQVIENEEISEDNYERLVKLYRDLYISKYTKYSPQLNSNFIELAIKNKILNMRALKKDGKIDAVMGYFAKDGVVTSPLFGYDINKPKDLGLYRMISTILTLEAKEKGLVINQSAGASKYKKLRKAKSEIEYTAVYTAHLSFARRLPWKMMRSVINSIGVHFMKSLG